MLPAQYPIEGIDEKVSHKKSLTCLGQMRLSRRL